MLTLRRCPLHFPFHAPQIHLKETHMSHHRMTEVSARFPLLAYSQNILKKYRYSTRTLGAAENKAFSASISRILYPHISKLKTQRVVAWIHAVGSWPISMECWGTSSTTKAILIRKWREIIPRQAPWHFFKYPSKSVTQLKINQNVRFLDLAREKLLILKPAF